MEKKNLLLFVVPEEFKEDKLCLKGILGILWGSDVPKNIDIVVAYCAFPANLVFEAIASYNLEETEVELSKNIDDVINKYNEILVIQEPEKTLDLTKFMRKEITHVVVKDTTLKYFSIYPDGYVCSLLNEMFINKIHTNWLTKTVMGTLVMLFKVTNIIERPYKLSYKTIFSFTRPLARILECRFTKTPMNEKYQLYLGMVAGYIQEALKDDEFAAIMADVTEYDKELYNDYKENCELVMEVSERSKLLANKAEKIVKHFTGQDLRDLDKETD